MSPRAKVIVLALIFVAPVTAAYLFFFAFPDWRPHSTTNYGTLVSPARPMPALALVDENDAPIQLERKWTLAYLGAQTCDASCEERVYLVRQIWKALDKNQRRVQRLYITPDKSALSAAQAQLGKTHPHMLFAADLGAPGARATDFFGSGPKADANAVYLLDPLGNWLMLYSGPELDPKGVLRDLKKLMRFSQVG